MMNFEINENGILKAITTFEAISDNTTLVLNISHPDTVQGVNIIDRLVFIEASKSFNGQNTTIYEQIINGRYTIKDNPKGTIIRLKVLFIKAGQEAIITNTINVQIGINGGSGILPELNTTAKLYNGSFCEAAIVGDIISFYNMTGQKVGQIIKPTYQADWGEINSAAGSFILNKPEIKDFDFEYDVTLASGYNDYTARGLYKLRLVGIGGTEDIRILLVTREDGFDENFNPSVHIKQVLISNAGIQSRSSINAGASWAAWEAISAPPIDGTVTDVSFGANATAPRATADANGNNIYDAYGKAIKSDISRASNIALTDASSIPIANYTVYGATSFTGTPSSSAPATILSAGNSGTISIISDNGDALTSTADITLADALRSLPNGIYDILVNGVLTKRIGKVVLVGTETYGTSSALTNAYRFTSTLIQSSAKATAYCISTHFVKKTNNSFDGDAIYINSSGVISINILKTAFSGIGDGSGSTANFKTWLTSNNVTILYELGTALTSSIAAPQIVTYTGITNIATSSDVNPDIAFTYTADTKIYTDVNVAEVVTRIPKPYGVRWNLTSDLQTLERVGDYTTFTVNAAIGNDAVVNDFNSIYPWSEIKRCSIKTNANGSVTLIYEGEDNFVTDGSDGSDVFVEIPKFYVRKYRSSGYQYMWINGTAMDGYIVHPIFIEGEKVLDKAYIAAYESSNDGTNMRSISDVRPVENLTASALLTQAKAKGTNYSLFGLRDIDALEYLLYVEYATRNSVSVMGHGWADLNQPAGTLVASAAGTGVNAVVYNMSGTAATNNYNSERFAIGMNIIILNGTTQTDVKARRSVTNFQANTPSAGKATITFDGAPINISIGDAIGNGSQMTGKTDDMLSPTGRTGTTPTYLPANEFNSNRYRYIENLTGNVWHMLSGINFKDRVAYICREMADYEFHKYDTTHKPVAVTFPLQTSNVDNSAWIKGTIIDNATGLEYPYEFGSPALVDDYWGGFYYMKTGEMCVTHGGGFDHMDRCNLKTFRAWLESTDTWYLYGCRMIYKFIT